MNIKCNYLISNAQKAINTAKLDRLKVEIQKNYTKRSNLEKLNFIIPSLSFFYRLLLTQIS